MVTTWSTHPTLSLLSTPWEYFVTIDQSALWQKHIAWAKPKGSDLKAYISSQYSSRMVLLSLLLATEMSVFFNSSPKLVGLRQRLNIWEATTNSEHTQGGYLVFWIGFVLLLNICVTISGILATFATWNVVSAISDSNAHCLLRSSLGQYVATLSPRLVVASLYFFLLWFLLFVVELLFGSASGSSLHELVSEHLHLVILWGCFLLAVMALFFSIVVPLSAFGRLVLHTGAMAEQPVLSEALQVELLPSGLHVGLVIKAHHSQKRGMAVTRQYQHRNKRRFYTGKSEEEEEIPSHRQQQEEGEKVDRPVSSLPRVVITDNVDDLGHLSNGHLQVEGSANEIEDTTSSVMLTQFGRNSTSELSAMSASTHSSENDNEVIVGSMNQQNNSTSSAKKYRKEDFSRGFQHRRMPTIETMASINLPPASILNLSMTAKELYDVIDNAMDTSSLYSQENSDLLPGEIVSEAKAERRRQSDERRDSEVYKNSDQDCENDQKISATTAQSSNENHSQQRSSNHESGIPLSPNPPSPQSPDDGRQTKRRNCHNHQDLVTRHHRRVSSSRFLLEEWAQENRVRDLYGAAPPAELPQEIAYMLKDQQQSVCRNDQSQFREANGIAAVEEPQNTLEHNYPWWTSPFSSPFGAFHKNRIKSSDASQHRNSSSQREISTSQVANAINDSLTKPLLPDLTSSRDEELGAGESSELWGERLLPSEVDRSQNTSVTLNLRNEDRRHPENFQRK